jgi:hypothetical protein
MMKSNMKGGKKYSRKQKGGDGGASGYGVQAYNGFNQQPIGGTNVIAVKPGVIGQCGGDKKMGGRKSLGKKKHKMRKTRRSR